MLLQQGTLTARLEPSQTESRYEVTTDVDNDSMRVHAHADASDVRVLLTSAVLPRTGFVPDGNTHRKILGVSGDHALVEVIFGNESLTLDVPCSSLSLMPSELDARAHLPSAQSEVVVNPNATILVKGEAIALRSFSQTPVSARVPAGMIAELRSETTDAQPPLVSLSVCGGTLFGRVTPGDLLGTPVVMTGSNARCPDVADDQLAHVELADARTCTRELTVSLRLGEARSQVGVLKACARFEIAGDPFDGWIPIRTM